jgi:diacylglycerol kinase family enzyme
VSRHDDQLDVAIVEAGPRIALARRALAMKRGELVHEDEVRHFRGRAIELGLGVRTPRFNVDGEVLEMAAARFEIAGAFEVVTP